MITTRNQHRLQQLSAVMSEQQCDAIELEPSYIDVKAAFHDQLSESNLRTLRTTEELVKNGRI